MSRAFPVARLGLAAGIAVFHLAANAQPSGYAYTVPGTIVTNSTGLCWHTSAWTATNAVEPCDRVAAPPRVQAPPPPVAAAPKPPEPAPAPKPVVVAPPPEPKQMPVTVAAVPAPKPAAPAPVIQRVSLSADVLFEFGSATLRDQGKEKLRDLARSLKDAEVESLTAIGHADRIGSDNYNRTLSEKRAQAVKEYLTELGIETKRIETQGAGAANPITAAACQGLRGIQLISCLQPDRRVEVEVRGQRRVASR
jgi:OOP family OmpA-OmpF porin